MANAEGNPFRHRPTSSDELLAEMWDLLHGVYQQTTATNGRVTALERWRIEVVASGDAKARESEAYARGVRDTLAGGPLLTKRQKAYLGAGFGAIAAAAPILSRVIERWVA